ncbi:MAG TPA: peptide MFS transporter [Gemmatimonadaceae bacterium]|nr:peptide MFS transporter [Gemmatimonadaceae bacterium]
MTTAGVFDDRSLLGHPKGLGLLFVTEMWERFSYYGMRALLVLYLVNAQQWTAERAANLYGTYTMLVYLTPLIGGYLADRLIGTRRSLVIGGIVIAAGHFTLAVPSETTFYAGLALIIIGTGFFKSNAATMVGQVYGPGDARRDSGFTIYYMGINLGAFLGPLACGYLGQSPRWGWHYGFACAGVGMVLGLIGYLYGREKYLPGIGLPERTRHVAAAGEAVPVSHPLHGVGGGTLGALIGWFSGGGSVLGLAMGAVIGAALGFAILGSHGEERKRVIALFLVAFFVVFFWAAYEQAGSSMNLFADRNTDLTLGGLAPGGIPSSWFQSINPFYILVFAPVFASLWMRLGRGGWEPSTPLKMVIGLGCLGLGFVFMIFGAKGADQGLRVSWLWLTTAYLFHTFGELCLSPIGLSYVSKISPVRFSALLMGVWYLSNAAANKLGGSVAAMVEKIPTLTQFYTIFVVSSFGAAFVMLLTVPLLKRLTASVKA